MNKKIIIVIGYIFIMCFMIIGGVILFHSDFAEPLKHLLGLGSCLAAMLLAWLLSNDEKRKSSKSAFLCVAFFTTFQIIISFIM